MPTNTEKQADLVDIVDQLLAGLQQANRIARHATHDDIGVQAELDKLAELRGACRFRVEKYRPVSKAGAAR